MKKLWFILGGLCVAGGLLSTQPAEAKSYLTITSTQNTSYNAR